MNQQAPQTNQTMPVQAQHYAFALNEASAMEAGASDYINEMGAYVFNIERAEFCQASTGAQGILFRLKTVDGTEKKATVILNYATKEGKTIFGANFINAILYLAGVPGFNWYPVQENGKQLHIAKEMESIQIGMVLEPAGKNKLELRQVFEPTSRLTASEAKQGLAPEAVQKLLNQLTH